MRLLDLTLESPAENLALDEALLEEARQLTGIRQKKQLVHEALKTLIRVAKRKPLTSLRGKLHFSSGYDYKRLRE